MNILLNAGANPNHVSDGPLYWKANKAFIIKIQWRAM